MFQSIYNGQKYLELFATNNQLLLKKWKIHASIKKIYDDQSKTYVYCLKGKSPICLMFWPKVKINVSDLTYPLIVFQIHFGVAANILIDIGLTTSKNTRKRITLSSKQKTARITLLSVVLPLALNHEETWSHLIIDVEDVVSSSWKEETFRNIYSISLGGVLYVKRIFTLRKDMIYSQEGTCFVKYGQLPKHMSLTKNVPQNYIFISCATNETAVESKDSSDQSSVKCCFSISNLSSNSVYSDSSGYSNDSGKDSTHAYFKSAWNRKDPPKTGLMNKSSISNVENQHSRELDMILDKNSIVPLLSRLSLSEPIPLCSSKIKPTTYSSKMSDPQLLIQEEENSELSKFADDLDGDI